MIKTEEVVYDFGEDNQYNDWTSNVMKSVNDA
jgi:hypothetical protein